MSVYDINMGRMVRTNVVLDEDLVRRVMEMFGLKSKRAAIDYALRRVAGVGDRKLIMELRGTGWIGDLDEMRRDEPPDTDADGPS
jgi:Arc/MetJ family transcription regulator